MQQAGQVLDSIKRQQERTARLAEITAPRSVRRYRRNAVDDYRSEMAGLVKRFGDDLSKCDFIAAMKLASKGREPDEIAKAMAEASPAIMERKAGHEADYIKRTVQKVMELPQVQEQLLPACLLLHLLLKRLQSRLQKQVVPDTAYGFSDLHHKN